ncbi:MAG: hydrogen gas-evolving membrane-bound hydrogenase subunit E [Candidatus Nanopelagicales bacterium]
MLIAALVLMAGAAALVPLLSRLLGRATGYPLAGAFLAAAGLLLVDAPEVLAGQTVTQSWSWVPSFAVDLTLRLNGLALLFAMLVLGVGALVLSYAPQYLSPGQDHGRLYGILAVFATAMLGLVLAGDLVVLVVFWELTTLSSFLLIAGQGTTGSRPATRALFVTAGGGLALLGAVVLLVVRTGSSDIATVLAVAPEALTGSELGVVGGLVVLAAFTKSAQLPFHFWLPGAMVAITPVSAYLHAASLVKAGIYLLLLFSPLFADAPAWHLTLMGVGLSTAVFGAYQALKQNDLKALLAYSTVSQLGLMVALVGVGTAASLAAATVLAAAHALFKATLFMLVGIIDKEAGSRDIRQLSGLWRVMPVTAGLTALAAMSMAGLPPMVGFVAKEEAFYAFLGTGEARWAQGAAWSGNLAVGVAVIGAALTFAYSARIIAGTFAGPLRQSNLYEPSALFLAPAAVPAILGLVLGLAPFLLNDLVTRAVVDTGFAGTEADLALWHGFSLALGLSATAIGLGIVGHLRRNRLAEMAHWEAPDLRGPGVFDRGWDAALRFGARVARTSRVDTAGTHLAGVLVLLLGLTGVGWLVISDLGPVVPGIAQPGDWLVLAVLVPAVLAMARVRDGLAALVLAGVIGVTLSAWLMLLGAPDVALTLLLVEILTVVVAAPVLAGLPDRAARRVGPAHALGAGAVGVLTALLVVVFTGRRERSAVSEYFLAEAERATGGSNVVNTILVDFRGLDTLGEIVVLAAAALGLVVAVRGAGATRAVRSGALGPGEEAVLRVGAIVVLPLLMLTGVVLFWRGHDEPGGGFIAGLVAGAALAVARACGIRVRLPGVPLIVGAGLLLAVGTGLMGLVVAGAFGQPMKIALPGAEGYLTSALVFDLGVVLVVLGLVQSALDNLGLHREARSDALGGARSEAGSTARSEVTP